MTWEVEKRSLYIHHIDKFKFGNPYKFATNGWTLLKFHTLLFVRNHSRGEFSGPLYKSFFLRICSPNE